MTEHRAWIYDVEVTHVRASPVRHEVRQRSYQWFVDLDALPRLPRLLRPLGRFDARDHVGDPRRSIRDNVDEFLAESGIVTWRVRGQIARHGIALYLKGVPLAPRPEPPEEMTMTSLSVATRLAAALRDAAGIDLPVRLRAFAPSALEPR